MHHHWIKQLVHDFEQNPRVQVKFHLTMMVFWMLMGVAGIVFILLFPHWWIAVGVLLVYELSIYANWDTDYGAVSAAQASLQASTLVDQENQADEAS